MAPPRTLQRLHKFREAEERQKKQALMSAIGDLAHLRAALQEAHDWARRGRARVNAGIHSGVALDRIAGLEEIAAADRLTRHLEARIHAAEDRMVNNREAFLAARIQRRQAEELLDLAASRDLSDAKRRGQRALDDWHQSRRQRNRSATRKMRLSAESGERADSVKA